VVVVLVLVLVLVLAGLLLLLLLLLLSPPFGAECSPSAAGVSRRGRNGACVRLGRVLAAAVDGCG